LDNLLLGHDTHRRSVVLPPERLAWHAAITGGTGRGKSTLLLNIVRQLMAQGAGVTVLDPGGDLACAVLQRVPPEREDDVLSLDLADRAHPFPLNILSARDAEEGAMLVEELLSVFHRLHATAWGPLLSHQLRMGLRAAMLTGGSLRDVLGLFTDSRFRARIVSHLRDPLLRTFWTEEFPTIRGAVTNKLVPLVAHPLLGPILCTPECVLDTDRVIADQQILVVNLASGSPGDDVSVLLGSFLVQKIIAAAFRQARLPERDRIPHVLVVDEFQRFMHRTASFDQILAEVRKYRLRLLVANQFAEQLDHRVRAALFGNVGTLAAFRLGHRDARLLAAEFPGTHVDDLVELGRGQCLVRIGADWTTLRTLPPPSHPADDPTPRIIAATFDDIRALAEQSADPKPAPDETEEEFVR
jgi:hypothetical protein